MQFLGHDNGVAACDFGWALPGLGGWLHASVFIHWTLVKFEAREKIFEKGQRSMEELVLFLASLSQLLNCYT